jgi:hypothetical protein
MWESKWKGIEDLMPYNVRMRSSFDWLYLWLFGMILGRDESGTDLSMYDSVNSEGCFRALSSGFFSG